MFLGHPRAQGTSGADAAWASVASAGLEGILLKKKVHDLCSVVLVLQLWV